MKTYTAQSDFLARGLHDGSIREIVIPITYRDLFAAFGVNPVRDFPNAGSIRLVDGEWRIYLREYPGVCIGTLKTVPYVPGDRIAVKERCAKCFCGSKSCAGYIYPDHLGWTGRDAGNRYQAKLMPVKAVRTHLVCESVACRERDGKGVWVVRVKREGD